jgi:lipoprotein-releasing system permease protein
MKYRHPINSQIAYTYTTANKKLTLVAALGIVIGMAIYIFMNSMMAGFERVSSEAIFKVAPHIRIYKDDEISTPLYQDSNNLALIINPKVVPHTNTILNPYSIAQLIEQQPDVVAVTPQVATNIFYNNGKSQIAGMGIGFEPDAGNKMFNIKSFMAEGNYDHLKLTPNGIIIGSGIAKKMNARTSENISITSSKGITKTMKVVGIFQSNNSKEDNTKSYINIQTAQQLLKQNNVYVTDINVNIKNPDKAPKYTAQFTQLTGYKAEDWQTANESLMAASRMRRIVITFVSSTILIVAGFGIYNILNMTITQKINDIAILKAMGFRGADVIKIFVRQALGIGFIGVLIGMFLATILVNVLQKVYIGGDIGYFPIRFEPLKFAQGILFATTITFLAGFIPARKAAQVDPVTIFRK